MARIRLTSLLLVEERLLEANYFAGRLKRQRNADYFGYELNSFLSAARSVTFILQKELAKVPGFRAWWNLQQDELRADPASRFFLELRNFSQKEGRISISGSTRQNNGRKQWIWFFAGTAEPVPAALLHRDVVDCCNEHLAKLATIILRCTEAFPYHCCPKRALTSAGVEALKLSLEDLEETAGLPDLGGESNEDRIRVLGEMVDGLDFQVIRRMTKWRPRYQSDDPASADVGDYFIRSLVDKIEARQSNVSHATLIAETLGEELLRSGKQPKS